MRGRGLYTTRGPPATPQYAYTSAGVSNVASTDTGQDLLDGYLQARNQTQSNGMMMTASGSAPVVGGDVGTEMGAMQVQMHGLGAIREAANEQYGGGGGAGGLAGLPETATVVTTGAALAELVAMGTPRDGGRESQRDRQQRQELQPGNQTPPQPPVYARRGEREYEQGSRGGRLALQELQQQQRLMAERQQQQVDQAQLVFREQAEQMQRMGADLKGLREVIMEQVGPALDGSFSEEAAIAMRQSVRDSRSAAKISADDGTTLALEKIRIQVADANRFSKVRVSAACLPACLFFLQGSNREVVRTL